MSPEKRIFCCRRRPCCRWTARLLLFASLTLAACSPDAGPPTALQTSLPPSEAQLTPYRSPTAQANTGTEKAVPTITAHPSTPTSPPAPTPTLRTHIVKKGEDLSGIAWQYRVSIEDLMAVNPTVQPNMMSVGTKLVIPPSKTPMPPGAAGAGQPAGEAGAAGSPPPTSTPLPVAAGKLNCSPAADGGIWCFMPVKNSGSITLEGLSAIFHVADRQAQGVVSQSAFLPLDTLPPGVSLPLTAYFPPDQIAGHAGGLTPPYQYSGEILTALPSADDGRYKPVRVENQQVTLTTDGLSANISANVVLDSAGKAGRVWVAAVAYDAQGNVTGVRRWEKTDTHPLEHGQALAFSMSVYSVSTRIERVDLIAEARP